MKYFTLFELEFSATAFMNGIKNVPAVENELNMIALIEKVLDPLRQAYGGPISVSSGFRNTKVNSFANGSRNSQHKTGEAADIYIPNQPAKNYKLAQLINMLGRYDQLILENTKSATDFKTPQWIHVSYKRTGTNRKQILVKPVNSKQYVQIEGEDLV